MRKRFKQHFCILSIAAAIWLAGITISTASEFVEGLEDVPLMNGMWQEQSDNISFGNDQSRFVEAYLNGGKKNFTEIVAFYMETLPQLGWRFTGKSNNAVHFEKEGEQLDIVREKRSPLIVRITLKSKN